MHLLECRVSGRPLVCRSYDPRSTDEIQASEELKFLLRNSYRAKRVLLIIRALIAGNTRKISFVLYKCTNRPKIDAFVFCIDILIMYCGMFWLVFADLKTKTVNFWLTCFKLNAPAILYQWNLDDNEVIMSEKFIQVINVLISWRK